MLLLAGARLNLIPSSLRGKLSYALCSTNLHSTCTLPCSYDASMSAGIGTIGQDQFIRFWGRHPTRNIFNLSSGFQGLSLSGERCQPKDGLTAVGGPLWGDGQASEPGSTNDLPKVGRRILHRRTFDNGVPYLNLSTEYYWNLVCCTLSLRDEAIEVCCALVSRSNCL